MPCPIRYAAITMAHSVISSSVIYCELFGCRFIWWDMRNYCERKSSRDTHTPLCFSSLSQPPRLRTKTLVIFLCCHLFRIERIVKCRMDQSSVMRRLRDWWTSWVMRWIATVHVTRRSFTMWEFNSTCDATSMETMSEYRIRTATSIASMCMDLRWRHSSSPRETTSIVIGSSIRLKRISLMKKSNMRMSMKRAIGVDPVSSQHNKDDRFDRF